MNDDKKIELEFTGNQALKSLMEVKALTAKAKKLGVWDILGGGTFFSYAKHFNIYKAKKALEQAKNHLQIFSDALNNIPALNINIGLILTCLDFEENFIANIVVQKRLSELEEKIDKIIIEIKQILYNINNNIDNNIGNN